MKKAILSALPLLLSASVAISQTAQQSWDAIKNATAPVVAAPFQSMFDAPYRQPLADYGWEDGLEISPDGLNLYALYSPMDLIGYTNFFTSNLQLPICDLFANMNYMRPYAGTYGMDMVTNYFSCDSFSNIDILYAHRNSVADNFSPWQLSGIARPGLIEGGPSPLFSETNPNQVELFMFTGNGDIWMINNTTANPSGINNAIRLPSPINPDTNEFNADNAFISRINGDTVILIYEKYTDASVRTFMYTISNNTGVTWNAPQAITTITNSLGHIEHPCLSKDNNGQWWLYFSINYASIVRAQQTIAGNWDSWAAPETIITVGNALVLGEPTVTQNGDISFSVGYTNPGLNDTTDVYDLDPWFLPRKSGTGIEDKGLSLQMNVFPNPAANEININYALPTTSDVTIEVVNTIGDAQFLVVNEKQSAGAHSFKYNTEALPAGLYICKLKAGSYSANKVIVKQ